MRTRCRSPSAVTSSERCAKDTASAEIRSAGPSSITEIAASDQRYPQLPLPGNESRESDKVLYGSARHDARLSAARLDRDEIPGHANRPSSRKRNIFYPS